WKKSRQDCVRKAPAIACAGPSQGIPPYLDWIVSMEKHDEKKAKLHIQSSIRALVSVQIRQTNLWDQSGTITLRGKSRDYRIRIPILEATSPKMTLQTTATPDLKQRHQVSQGDPSA
ncbi:hypothetical protein TCAL_11224, partial [Tigriopus californicus]